jgi:hypothetical protein
MVVGCAKRLILASITDAIDISHDSGVITGLSLGTSVALAAIKG